MPKGIIILHNVRLAGRFRRSLLMTDNIYMPIDFITIPSPYTGYFWYENEKVMVSDYDYVVILSLDELSKQLYTYLKPHIKVFGDPYVRAMFDNKMTGQEIVSEQGIPVIPFVYGNVNKDVHLSEFKDKVVEKPTKMSCGNGVCLYDLPLKQVKPNRIYQQYIECDATDQRWIVVGDRIVCAMQRKSVDENEFRANLSVGGEGTPIEITDEMQEMARKIVEPFPNYLYAGIDIITDKDGKKYFLEANMNPGDHIIQVTYHNYFNDVYMYILSELEKEKN